MCEKNINAAESFHLPRRAGPDIARVADNSSTFTTDRKHHNPHICTIHPILLVELLFPSLIGDTIIPQAEPTTQNVRPKKRTPQLTKVGSGVEQEARFEIALKKTTADKQKAYRERLKVQKQHLKENAKHKWEEIGGVQKVCMGIRQHDIRELRRIAQLGTCPTARGPFVPTARIASYMALCDLSIRSGFSTL